MILRAANALKPLIALAAALAAAPVLAGTYGTPDNAPSRVTVAAVEPSWVHIHSVDGSVSWTRTLQPGESYRAPDRPGLLIDTGNTRGLKVSVDGKEMPTLGKPGASIVQHDISIDPDRAGAPAPRTAPQEAVREAAKPRAPAIAVEPVAFQAAAAVVAPQAISTPAIRSVAFEAAPPTLPVQAPTVAVVQAAEPPPAAARPTRIEDQPPKVDDHGIGLEIGKGSVIQLHQPASTVFVANPDIADVQVKSPTLIYIYGKTPGETSLYAADGADHIILQAPVRVTHNLSRLRAALTQMMPNEPIRVDSIEGAIVLTGTVSSPAAAADAVALANLFTTQSQAPSQGQASGQSGSVQLNVQAQAGTQGQGQGQGQGGPSSSGGQGGGSSAPPAGGGSVINRLAVLAPVQVNIRVRVAEVARSTLRELGVNWSNPSNSAGFLTSNPVLLANQTAENYLKVGIGPSTAQIDAMAQEGLITTLAEPNLTAMSGQTASFLAGGEFPIPVATTTSNGIPTLTIEFKKYGVSIDFVPTILDSRRVNLRIRSEVSQLTQQGAVQSNGITIPAIQVRRTETSVELGSGASFAIAGLLQNDGEHDISKIPALGDLPILGPLFRSDRFQRQETELVIMVTPYLVQPMAVAGASPADGLQRPDDLHRELTGAPYRQTPADGPNRGNARGLVGPAGFQLD